jgi:ATP-binding cassette subfamily F protein 3
MLAGALPFDAGERVLGSHVEVQYYAQHQLDALDPTRTVLEELEQTAPEAPIARLRTILGRFLFSGDTVEKKVAVLSGGEKARLALAKMLARPAALLCMDEPTNHLDLASKEVLEEALSGFSGTIVFISHDRYFINRIATQVVEVDRGHLTTYLGSYDDYLAGKTPPAQTGAQPKTARDPARGGQPTATVPRAPDPRQSSSPGAFAEASTRKKSKGLDREIKSIKVRLGAVEAQIHEMEARLQEIGLALADPDLYRDGQRARDIAQARKDTEERVAWLMKEWEELSLRLSTVSGDDR